MARDIYLVTPQVAEPLNENLIGRDEVPKPPTSRDIGKLSAWLPTPMGQAFYAWARGVPGWDVVDMNDEHIYITGSGGDAIFWVPARTGGAAVGAAKRYYWIPIKITLDRQAMAAADALQIQQDAANAKTIADARAAAGGAYDASKYGGGGAAGGTLTVGFKPSKELSLFEGPSGRIWVASNKSQSGTNNGPHEGIFLALPDGWDLSQWGKPEDNGLPPGAYLLSMDDPEDTSTIRPAGQEYATVLQRAIQGDENARWALQTLGVTRDLPPPSAFERLEDFFGF